MFDGLHEGHRYFLSQAKALCDELVVVVTRDETAGRLKARTPKQSFEDRAGAIGEFDPLFKVVPGDATLGEWKVVKEHRPDMVFLGYDQKAIAPELEKLRIPFTFLDPYHPEKYKSSLLDRS